MTSWRFRYLWHRSNAKKRGIPFLLTFEDWCAIWRESGKWDQNGWGKGQYCMARYGDKGAYELGNVRVCLAEENRAERNRNYPMLGDRNPAYGKGWQGTPEQHEHQRAIASLRFKGKPKSAAQRVKMGRPKPAGYMAEIRQERIRRSLRNDYLGWA